MCFFKIALMRVVPAEIYKVALLMPLLHVSLLLNFTAAAAAEEMRSRRQQHANLDVEAEAALHARRKERTRLAGVYKSLHRN